MNIDDVRTFYTYNRWANDRVCQAAHPIDIRDLTRDLKASLSSVRGTLVHIMWAEWLWLQRWRGESPTWSSTPMTFRM